METLLEIEEVAPRDNFSDDLRFSVAVTNFLDEADFDDVFNQ